MYKLRQLTHKLNVKFVSELLEFIHISFPKNTVFNPYNSYSWTSCLFSTLNTNNSWWIIFSYSYAATLQKKVVRQTEILIYKFLSNDVE